MEKELNEQFNEFLKTKGLVAKFKLVVENLKESTKEQHKKDVENFNKVKEQSIEENKDFVEFLHTKGLKAKVKLVIENIKKGASAANQKTKEQIEKSKQYGKANSPEDLTKEFNLFLKQKGLDSKYVITIEQINN